MAVPMELPKKRKRAQLSKAKGTSSGQPVNLLYPPFPPPSTPGNQQITQHVSVKPQPLGRGGGSGILTDSGPMRGNSSEPKLDPMAID